MPFLNEALLSVALGLLQPSVTSKKKNILVVLLPLSVRQNCLQFLALLYAGWHRVLTPAFAHFIITLLARVVSSYRRWEN